ARRHQLHRVAKCLQLATPVMGRRTGLDADQARLQAGKELQQLRPTDTLANNHRPSRVDAVSLEYRLRNIETDRDNLAHGRLPSKWCTSTQPPYGTPMPQSGRRPQHQSRRFQPVGRRSALPPQTAQKRTFQDFGSGPEADMANCGLVESRLCNLSSLRLPISCGLARQELLRIKSRRRAGMRMFGKSQYQKDL